MMLSATRTWPSFLTALLAALCFSFISLPKICYPRTCSIINLDRRDLHVSLSWLLGWKHVPQARISVFLYLEHGVKKAGLGIKRSACLSLLVLKVCSIMHGTKFSLVRSGPKIITLLIHLSHWIEVKSISLEPNILYVFFSFFKLLFFTKMLFMGRNQRLIDLRAEGRQTLLLWVTPLQSSRHTNQGEVWDRTLLVFACIQNWVVTQLSEHRSGY